MPEIKPLHFNPPTTFGKTRCGRDLKKVSRYTSDPDDTTCNSCLKLIEKDKKVARGA